MGIERAWVGVTCPLVRALMEVGVALLHQLSQAGLMQPSNVNLHFPESGIWGMALLTDYRPLAEKLDEAKQALDRGEGAQYESEGPSSMIPGFTDAVMTGVRLLESRRLRANVVTYFNFRVQVWAMGFDADGTPPIRVIPSGVMRDLSGPVTFPNASS